MAKKKRSAPRPPIPRETRRFQLRLGDQYPVDKHVQAILNFAKTERREVTLIRDAISLYWALEQGDLEALYSKFPQYRGQSGNKDCGELNEIKGLLQDIMGKIKSDGTPSLQPITGTAIPAPQFALPTFEDDGELPMLKVKKNEQGGDSANLFLKSMGAIQ